MIVVSSIVYGLFCAIISDILFVERAKLFDEYDEYGL